MGKISRRKRGLAKENPYREELLKIQREEYLQIKEHILKRNLPASEYPRAWAKYNRIFYSIWLSFPLLPLLLMIAALIGLFNPLAGWIVIAWIAALIILIFSFYLWPCPRCGKSFSSLAIKGIGRPERCPSCGIQRNAVPRATKE